DALYENQPLLGPPLYASIVKVLGLSEKELIQALNEHAYLPKIKADFEGGVLSGVKGTPPFFVNGDHPQGGYDLGSLAEAIEAHRRRAGVHHGSRRSKLGHALRLFLRIADRIAGPPGGVPAAKKPKPIMDAASHVFPAFW